jgi:acetyltransferase-like isoleucine patch superfamily enzyme
MPQPIVLFGSSGNASTLRTLMRRTETLEPLYDVVAYVDDYRGDAGVVLDGCPVISFPAWQERFTGVPGLITLGDPGARRTIAERLHRLQIPTPAIFDARELGMNAVGKGAFVATGLRFDPSVSFGRFAMIYPFVTMSAGTALGDYVTLCPRATLHGPVSIGDGTFVGAAAKIIADHEPVHIGCNVRIVAGAVVRTSIPDGVTVFGDPARIIRGRHLSS